MHLYNFRGANGDVLQANARTERAARQIVMQQRWGTTRDNVTPHAPRYFGDGLFLYSVEYDTEKQAEPIAPRF